MGEKSSECSLRVTTGKKKVGLDLSGRQSSVLPDAIKTPKVMIIMKAQDTRLILHLPKGNAL